MSDVDPNLVKAIAEQVLAAIRVVRGGGVSLPAEIHAPVGECTGDYSKFVGSGIVGAPGPEYRPVGPRQGSGSGNGGLTATATKSGGLSGQPGAPAAEGVTALTGVITVSHLKGVKGVIRLAKGAMLTPLAVDYVKEKHLRVMSDEGATTVNAGLAGGGAGIATGAPIFWWIGGQCPSVAKVVEMLRPNVLASRERSSGESLRGVVKELAGLIKTKRVGCGLLFVDSAARAACYANRCHSLRAIVGTNDKAVSDGVEQLGANVLIIEYPQLGYKGMMGLIQPFLESQQAAPAAVLKELNELAACG